MEIHCPHCHSTVDIDPDAGEIPCPSCGSHIEPGHGGPRPWPAPEPPRQLGRFDILDQLGVGAFGAVWKARDRELDRLVAIKIPLPEMIGGPEDVERFLRESRSAAHLKHPGIVAVYDAGQTDGTCYLVSEFVEGVNLEDRLKEGPLSFRFAAKLAAEVADALQYAHDNGVVHRDVKPSNVMLDADKRPHLMDFGLAKRAADDANRTLDGQIIGTPAYMAPEQARGEVRKIDARSDVYGLGVILYEMLADDIPFHGQTRMMLLQVIQDEPRPPRRLNDRIPKDLETVCLKAMAKEPGRRYQTAREFGDDLRRFLAGEPVRARPVGTLERAWAWARRRPALVALLVTAAVAVLALAVGGVSLSYSSRLEAANADLEAAVRKTREQKDEADRQRALAEARGAEARRYLYLARLSLAGQAWQEGNINRVRELLQGHRPGDGGEDLRGFEWFLLWRYAQAGRPVLRHHADRVNAVAASPRGNLLASGGDDGKVVLWDAKEGKIARKLEGHAGAVRAIAFSPAGDTLATASWDRTLKLWDAGSGKALRTFTGHRQGVTSVALGKRLVSGSADRTVRVWDLGSGEAVRVLKGHRGRVTAVALSPDGKTVVSAGEDQTVRAWDAELGGSLWTFDGHAADVVALAFSPDGRQVATASWDRTVKLLDGADGRELRTLAGHNGYVTAVAFSRDGARLASGSWDQTVRLWETASGRGVQTAKGHTDQVTAVTFLGDRLASASVDGTVQVWEVLPTPGPVHVAAKGLAVDGVGLAFDADGRSVGATAAEEGVTLWDLATGREVGKLGGKEEKVRGVALQRGAELVATAGHSSVDSRKGVFTEGAVVLWDPRMGKRIRSFAAQVDYGAHLTFSAAGDRLAGASATSARAWDTRSGKVLATVQGHDGPLSALTFSPDGGLLATASHDRTVKVWSVSSDREVFTLKGHTGRVSCVAIGPEGRRLASGSDDETVRVWDLQTGKEVFVLKGHGRRVQGVCFSPAGRRLVSFGADRALKFWDLRQGQEVLTLPAPSGAPGRIAFSRDGRRLAVFTQDGTAAMWDAGAEMR